ncbi:hypothetical protein INT48_001784 [Thamnidium elegans]|uniref:Suppressor of forked domain-containing protein n=1 Tax=Thamnidium elegans TaxID=101142 RepID=A0A8H7SXH5_9FUNG|nr:hypothetical protein INT48_001784 [Thamnidium elegans]
METNEPTVQDYEMQDTTAEENQAAHVAEQTAEVSEADKTLQALEALPELMEKLEEDDTQYQLHVQLIETLKQADLPNELEQARINMHKVFPLTEALWLEWINDTKKEADTEEGREKLMALYNQAQEDYLSIEIWKSYVEYILDNFHAKFDDSVTKEDELIQTTRQDLLHAVGATQFHVKQSQQIWKAFIEFEMELLNKYKDAEQQKRVHNAFVQRLGVLHIDYQDTFDSLSSFISTWDNANYETIMMQTTPIYARTKKAAEERDIFEMKITASGYSLDAFYEYIENEKVSKNMSCINNIEKGRIGSQLDTVTLRAIRFFDTALSSKQLLSSMDDLVTILLAKIDYVRRKIDWEEATQDDLIDIQLVFAECLEYYNEAFPDTADPYYRIQKYHAFIAEKRLYDIEKARELWQEIVETHGRDTEAWIQYITFERNQNNYQLCETLFKKALQKNVDNPMRLIDTWNSMEREFGTLESFERAAIQMNRKVKTFSRQWQAALVVQEEYNEPLDTEKPIVEDAPETAVKDKEAEKPTESVTEEKPVENTVEETHVEAKEETSKKEHSTDEPKELDFTLKRKASEGDLNEEEAKKHKSNEKEEAPRESLPPPRKPFNPLPRAARSRRGKSLALHGSKSLGRQDVHQVKDPVVPDTPEKTNDDFRNMLLGKK